MAKAMIEVKDSFIDLERHRLRLEENASKLRKSLQHWQTWEAEYEGMKEQIESLDDQYSVTELEHAATESVGILLDEKEVNLILHDDKGRHRSGSQIIGLLSRRIDYVQQNVTTVTSLLSTAEEKLAASFTIRPDVHNEEGLPLTEIREDLDEEGNVISSSTSAPGDAAPQVVEALRKGGVGGFSDTPEHISQSDIDIVGEEDQSWVTEDKLDTPATSILKSPKLQVSGSPNPSSEDSFSECTKPRPSSRRKSVTFAEGTKLTDASISKPKQVSGRRALKTVNEIKLQAGLMNVPGRLVKPNKSPKRNLEKSLGAEVADNGGRAISSQPIQETTGDALDDSTEGHKAETAITSSKSESSIGITLCYPSSEPTSRKENNPSDRLPDREVGNRDTDIKSPVIPVNESPEDAAIRRLMLEYSMNEVGAVVAEIELDEGDDLPSDASHIDDEGGANSDASSIEEDEDEYGRTKRRVLDDAYFEEMRALEMKLNATVIQNVGPHGHEVASPIREKVGRSTPGNGSSEDPTNPSSKGSMSKVVRFAEELDVQNAPSKDSKISVDGCISTPFKENIIERSASAGGSVEPAAAPKKKISRFKSARTGGPTISSPNIESNVPVADSIPYRNSPQKNTLPPLTSNKYHLPNDTAFTAPHGTRQVPTGPVNRPHAANVMERPYSPTADPSTAVDPDELDPVLLHQQVATEYHRMHNRMIHRQGGFLATDEEKAEVPLIEGEGGAPKISRFKAARLAQLR